MSPIHLTKKIKQAHFETLVAVAFIDGFLDEEEKRFLAEKAQEFALSRAEVEEIIGHPESLEMLIPGNEGDKEELLADAIYLSMVNGELNPKEYELCIHLSQRLRLDQQEVDKTIELITKLWRNQ